MNEQLIPAPSAAPWFRGWAIPATVLAAVDLVLALAAVVLTWPR